MRLATLVILAVTLEIGWLAVWSLSGTLSHSALFNAAFLADHPLAAQVFQATLVVARRALPSLAAEPLSEPLGAPAYQAPAWALAAAFTWLAGAYLLALRLLSGSRAPKRSLTLVIVSAIGFQATLGWLPGVFSQDVFSYIAYGRLAVFYELNPYVWPPSATPKDVALPWVASIWRTYPAPYGPVWLDVQSALAHLAGEWSIAAQALAYRALANALALVNLALLWVVLGRLAPLDLGQRVTALAAMAWNPLVLFEVAANAHNDVLMITFSLVALLLTGRAKRAPLAAAGFSLGALVKYLSGVGVVWVALAAAADAASLSRRALRLALVAGTAAIVVLIMALPWLELPDSLEPLLAETATVGYVNSLPDRFGLALADHVIAPLARSPEAARDATRTLSRVILLSVFGVYLVWEGRQVWRCPRAASVARATARACLIYILLVSTSVQTWYFCLPVALSLALGWRATLARITVGFSLLALPALYLSYYLRESTPWPVFVVYGLAPLLPLVWPARPRAGALSHVPAALAVSDDEQAATAATTRSA